MNTNKHRLEALIAKGEGLDIEFKACRNQLPKSLYQTVCAFLNRHGGTLLLGVQDDGTIQGIAPDALEQVRKDFVTAINNPQKLTPPTYLSIDETELGGKKLLHIYVPESSQVHRCNGRIFDRNEDGDFDITDNTVQVARLYQRKQATYSENRVYPWIQPGDLRTDLIDRCRRHVRINRKNHPWADMDDAALLQSAQLVQTDPETGKSGVTLAGVMLFGHDAQIRQACPAHRTDLLLRKVDVDRYDDRDLVITNLIDSYDRILAFVQKHLPDPFYLEGIERRSLRDHIFREVASNMLIHREYASGATSRFVIEFGRVVTDNPSRPHGFGILDPETCVPYQKNPILSAFFREIDRADELGSGMRKMMLYGKKYGGADPQLIEGDNFRMVISVPEFGKNPAKTAKIIPTEQATGQVEAHDEAYDEAHDEAHDLSETELAILKACRSSPQGVSGLLIALGYKTRTGNFKKAMLRLEESLSLLEKTLPDSPRSKNQKYRLTAKGKKVVTGRES
jgi:ATP-dependent DNA helicase RecG